MTSVGNMDKNHDLVTWLNNKVKRRQGHGIGWHEFLVDYVEWVL